MHVACGMTAKEIINDFREKYSKVRKLLDEDSRNDPENEPYISKYKARKILFKMYETLKQYNLCSDPDVADIKTRAMLGAVFLNIGIIDMETEDPAASERILTEAMELLLPDSSKPEIVIILTLIHNNLGILWSNRNEPEKAKAYLISAKELYEKFKCTSQVPLSIEHIINNNTEAEVGDCLDLEKAYTLTLYYLAQVYGTMKEKLKSAVYCHVTLRRQLQYSDYEPIDWALNSATLSQFFGEQNGFYQARYHLAAASTILEQHGDNLMASESDDEEFLAKIETFKHRSADVARCWAKYCLMLMTSSKARLMSDAERLTDAITDLSNLRLDDDENICGGNIKNLVFRNLDVTKYENNVSDKFILTFDDARKVFLSCQDWLNKAKEYYKLDTLASDYADLIQDSSQAYNNLAFFEPDDERRAKMHKRRIDIMEEVVKELNPTYYMHCCRQLWYELADVHSEILNIKLDKLSNSKEPPTPHAVKKINMLCDKSIEYYEQFLGSIRDNDGKMPAAIDLDLIRPVISSLAYSGRNGMKRVAVNKAMQLNYMKKSLEYYQAVIDICTNDKGASGMMHVELNLCQQMATFLPIKIKKFETELEGTKTE